MLNEWFTANFLTHVAMRRGSSGELHLDVYIRKHIPRVQSGHYQTAQDHA